MTMETNHRLLVIDDSSTIRKLVELSFRGAPFTLEFAVTGAEGIAKGLLGPDVILLDCVLPDMKAADVCQKLVEDPRGRSARVILMSAKDREALRGTFERFPQVIDFVGKPFTADEILARVRAVVTPLAGVPREPGLPGGAPAPVVAAGGPANGVPGAPSLAAVPIAAAPAAVASETATLLGPKETEAAAKALYARLHRPLGSVPEWVRQATATAGTPAAIPAFLARKLLTPELVSSLLDALLPFYRQALRAEAVSHAAAVAVPPRDPDEGAPLRGQIAGWSLTDLLAFVGEAARTGELTLGPVTGATSGGAERLLLHWESGEIVACTSFDPLEYLRGAEVDLSGVSAEIRARAEAEQRESGVPVYVTLAEAGALPSEAAVDLTGLLHERGVRLLRQARGASALKYAWRDRPSLPSYVVTWGRHLSLSDDLGAPEVGGVHPTEPTIAQLSLERLRRPSAWGEADLRLPGSDQCFDRAFGFSQKLRALRLTASEQRVLSLVDRQNPLRAITLRSGLPAREVARILYRLAEIELIQPLLAAAPAVSAISGSAPGVSVLPGTGEPAARPVMILDPDDDGFCHPLREMLARRPRPVPLLDLSGELDVTDAISRERPGLVVLNETAARGKLEEIARAVRAAPHLSGTALAAVLEPDATTSADGLVAAGFDAVWTKPVHYLDLVSLLAADQLAGPAPAPAHPPFSQPLAAAPRT